MGSKLSGLFRTLKWSDFSGPQPASNPDNMWAQAAPEFSPKGISTTSNGSGSTQSWSLADSVLVSITFNSAKSWVLPSVKKETADEQARLLKHEQGHYDLVALLARDMFLEFMQLKNARLSSSSAVANEVRAVHSRYANIAQPLQDLYDSKSQTDHGRNQANQDKWNGYIKTAFTTERTPRIVAPDNKAYKLEILSVLRSAGVPI